MPDKHLGENRKRKGGGSRKGVVRERVREREERREKGERGYDKINKLHKPLLDSSAFY